MFSVGRVKFYNNRHNTACAVNIENSNKIKLAVQSDIFKTY